jgi:pimeloyl-ACP methyl ester carboxylesterase
MRRLILASLVLLVPVPVAASAQTPASSEIAITSAGDQLRGTLLVPARTARGAEPVLMLAGSGATDRNGNNIQVSAQPYRLLADALAARGITTLRVDKRGIGGSAAGGHREEELRVQMFADDANAWAAELRRRTGAHCVWLLGHSEGTMHALLAAPTSRDLCGLILLSPAGRRIGDVLRAQLRGNPANAPLLNEALHDLAELEAGRRVPGEGMNQALLQIFRPSVQPFMISLLAVDPPALARAYRGRILIVNGTTDLQTPVADARALATARPGIVLRIIDGMNHVLKLAPADFAANFATYGNPDLPLAPELVDAVTGFILSGQRLPR